MASVQARQSTYEEEKDVTFWSWDCSRLLVLIDGMKGKAWLTSSSAKTLKMFRDHEASVRVKA